jgi:hypothetical protein
MVAAVRAGASMRSVARAQDVSLSTVQWWLRRAGRRPLDEVDWSDHTPIPGRTRRTQSTVEDVVQVARRELKETSDLGEYGARAIHREPAARGHGGVPAVRTIGRILERRGALDGRRRLRRPPPPPGSYLPACGEGRTELDSFDTVEGLTLEGGLRQHRGADGVQEPGVGRRVPPPGRTDGRADDLAGGAGAGRLLEAWASAGRAAWLSGQASRARRYERIASSERPPRSAARPRKRRAEVALAVVRRLRVDFGEQRPGLIVRCSSSSLAGDQPRLVRLRREGEGPERLLRVGARPAASASWCWSASPRQGRTPRSRAPAEPRGPAAPRARPSPRTDRPSRGSPGRAGPRPGSRRSRDRRSTPSARAADRSVDPGRCGGASRSSSAPRSRRGATIGAARRKCRGGASPPGDALPGGTGARPPRA